MAPAVAIQLISQYGIPAAKAIYDVYKTWKDKREITDADWQDMLAINARPLEFYEGTSNGNAGVVVGGTKPLV